MKKSFSFYVVRLYACKERKMQLYVCYSGDEDDDGQLPRSPQDSGSSENWTRRGTREGTTTREQGEDRREDTVVLY